MQRCGPFLTLNVPGLAEGRPSLIVGDSVLVCEPGQYWILYSTQHTTVEPPNKGHIVTSFLSFKRGCPLLRG